MHFVGKMQSFYVKKSGTHNCHCVWNSWYSWTVYSILLALEFTKYLEFFCGMKWNIVHCVSGAASVPVCGLPPWRNSPQWARASSLSRLHDHTQDTPHSVGLLWTSDQPHAETSTWQHTTLTRDGRRTHNSSKRTAADPLLRTRGPLGSSIFRLTSSETTVIILWLFILLFNPD